LQGKPLSEQVTNPNIIVGRYSYYAGYYHGYSFDHCARYLLPDDGEVDKLIIGSFCSIATGVAFMMHGNQGHRTDWISTFPFFYMAPREQAFAEAEDPFRAAGDTIIGNDVWIGSEAMIMPGVKVGHGAVIGSRAVVTRDVEPYTVVCGNPARPVRKRFSDEEIAMLLEMAWWDWPLEQIKDAVQWLCSSDIAELYRFWSERKLPPMRTSANTRDAAAQTAACCHAEDE
jgi:chloramphenicol O-acetyltransferase type B